MIDRETFDRYAADPSAFRDDLIVDVDGVARRFGDVQDPWQRADFTALDPALLRCAGRSDQPVKMRAWLERGRGHSKTTDLSITCAWAMAFASRPLKAYGFAADRDQSRLLLDAVARLIRLNPWLASILEIQSHKVVNVALNHPGMGSTLTIEASDVGSSYGILPDIVIADEICHWEDGAAGLWESLISSVAKRTGCLFVVISNSGFVDSWQWKVREAVRADKAWIFSRLEGHVASWLTPDRLDEQRRLLPPIAFERLWGNNWSSGGGDALSGELVDLAFKSDLRPIPAKVSGWEFVAGVDLGVSRDASALVVLGVRKRNAWDKEEHAAHARIRVAFTRRWKPSPGHKVNLQEIEEALRLLHKAYQFKSIHYDSWQAEHLSQRLALIGLPMVECAPTGTNLQKIATAVIEAFNDRRVDCFPDEDLQRDLRRLRVEERSYGFRLVSPHDEHGHGDSATAFGLAMSAASEIAGKKILLAGPMFDASDASLSKMTDRNQELYEQRVFEIEMRRTFEADPMVGRRHWAEMIRQQHPERF